MPHFIGGPCAGEQFPLVDCRAYGIRYWTVPDAFRTRGETVIVRTGYDAAPQDQAALYVWPSGGDVCQFDGYLASSAAEKLVEVVRLDGVFTRPGVSDTILEHVALDDRPRSGGEAKRAPAAPRWPRGPGATVLE